MGCLETNRNLTEATKSDPKADLSNVCAQGRQPEETLSRRPHEPTMLMVDIA